MSSKWITWSLLAVIAAATVGGCMDRKPASLTGDEHPRQGVVDINTNLP